jgi:hypothetical protein
MYRMAATQQALGRPSQKAEVVAQFRLLYVNGAPKTVIPPIAVCCVQLWTLGKKSICGRRSKLELSQSWTTS